MSTIYEDNFHCVLFDGSEYTLLRGYHFEKKFNLFSDVMNEIEKYMDSLLDF